jgi:hypothetical protein
MAGNREEGATMGMIEHFKEYTVALEGAYHDDDWSRLAPYFAENTTYRSH